MKYYDETGKILCQECGKSFDVILPTHLKKFHNMSMDVYKQKYPGIPLASQSFGSKQKYKNTVKAMKEDELKKESSGNEFSLDKIPIVQEKITKTSESFFNDLKDFANNPENLPIKDLETEEVKKFNDPSIHKTKLVILNFLASYFIDLKNSYFIEKINLSGKSEYRLITDVCSPSHKIDFEFNDAFWHNYDLPKTTRDQLLEKDGWKIINFQGTPSVEKIKKVLEENDLI